MSLTNENSTVKTASGERVITYLKKPTSVINLAIVTLLLSVSVWALTDSVTMFKLMLLTTVIVALMVKVIEWEMYNTRRVHRNCVPAGVGLDIFNTTEEIISEPVVPNVVIGTLREKKSPAVKKVALSNPKEREFKDLTSPAVVQEIWENAAKVVREEAPVIARRVNAKKTPVKKVTVAKKTLSKKLVAAGHWSYGDHSLKREPNVASQPWIVTDSAGGVLGSVKTLKEAQLIVDNLNK